MRGLNNIVEAGNPLAMLRGDTDSFVLVDRQMATQIGRTRFHAKAHSGPQREAFPAKSLSRFLATIQGRHPGDFRPHNVAVLPDRGKDSDATRPRAMDAGAQSHVRPSTSVQYPTAAIPLPGSYRRCPNGFLQTRSARTTQVHLPRSGEMNS